ncbi:MAG TPA: isochorismatase family protein [Ottowia sp.]|nr:isochorismatase family protein [Ottowia sp.]
MLLDADDSQLVLIDYQARLMPAIHDAAAVLANARRLAQMARWMGVPVWATEQNPDKLGGTDAALAPLCDRIVPKMAFSGADELLPLLAPPAAAPRGNARSLPRHLQKPAAPQPERGTVVIAGCEAHVCLLQTALLLLEAEWDVWVVQDACGSRTERNRDAAYDRLAGAGCELVTTEMVGFEWLRDCQHPQFKPWQGLIK